MATNEELLAELGYANWDVALKTKLEEIGPDLLGRAEKEWKKSWGDVEGQRS